MDINTIRSLLTVAALVAFLGIVWWAYLPQRREGLDAEARRILDEGEL